MRCVLSDDPKNDKPGYVAKGSVIGHFRMVTGCGARNGEGRRWGCGGNSGSDSFQSWLRRDAPIENRDVDRALVKERTGPRKDHLAVAEERDGFRRMGAN